VHLIGHSYGAYISAFAGGHVQKTNNKKLKRITGLDPGNFSDEKLQNGDAEFVDIIHTNPGVGGTSTNLGTVNFYPNMKRKLQPGCPSKPKNVSEMACSHNRAILLYAESVKKYKNTRTFLSSNVERLTDPKIQMGINCPMTATGRYKLTTKGKSPYSKT